MAMADTSREGDKTSPIHPKIDGRKSPPRRAREAASRALTAGGDDFAEVMRLFDAELGNDGAAIKTVVSESHWHTDRASFLRRIKLDQDGKTTVTGYTRNKPDAGKPNGDGHSASDTQDASAAANGEGGQRRVDTHVGLAPSADLTESSRQGPSAADRAAGVRVQRRLSNSLLDTYMVDGVPIRYRTKSECESAARRRKTDSAFLLAISHALPTPEAVVGDYIDDDIADEAMQAAVKAAA